MFKHLFIDHVCSHYSCKIVFFYNWEGKNKRHYWSTTNNIMDNFVNINNIKARRNNLESWIINIFKTK